MDKNHQNDKEDLSIFFKASRDLKPRVSPDLTVRILQDASQTIEHLDLDKNQTWFQYSVAYFRDSVGLLPTLGFVMSLLVGVGVGFYSPVWVESIATGSQMDISDEIDFNSSFFGLNEFFKGI